MTILVLATTSAELEAAVHAAADGPVLMLPAGPLPADPAHFAQRLGAEVLPDVIVLGPGVPVDAALALGAAFDRSYPGTSVILATGGGPEEWLAAIRAGIRDVVPPDATVGDLREVLRRAAAGALARKAAALGAQGTDSGPGRIIPVVSPKGGCGKTTVATNLAVGLARSAPQQVVLVDLDLQFGDVATALNLAPEAGLLDALQRRAGVDAMVLKTYLSPHPAGLFALCAPDTPAAGEVIGVDDVHQLLDTLAAEFRYVVVDTGAGLTEHTLSALDRATDAVLLCGMDVPSVRGMRKELDVLRELSMTHMTRHMVLNFVDRRSGLTVADVEGLLDTRVDVVLPRSRNAPLATNQGIPLLQQGGRDPLAKELTKLVSRFAAPPAKPSRRRPRHAVAR